ncbi:hypothetical protein GWK47_030068 [Chionoecetes opilio]|uniref:Uncharacterized protein n=1 Tax=Chionoecetes opilio TaxID=41210 RepID=A0A8J5D4W8_CHIOP|nr:hypothetical protein GWK47_030068 [Chionoecetes opilio]
MKRQKEAINNWRDHLKRNINSPVRWHLGLVEAAASNNNKASLVTEQHPLLTPPDGSVVTKSPGVKAKFLESLHLLENFLDRVQPRARHGKAESSEADAQIIQPLQQRRDVVDMCVMYRLTGCKLLQLAELRLNPRAPASHATQLRPHNIDHQVTDLPFPRTEHYLAPLLPRYGRLGQTPGAPDRPCTTPLPCTPSNRA